MEESTEIFWEFVTTVTPEEVAVLSHLYQLTGWLEKGDDTSYFPAMIAGSFRVLFARHNRRLIASGRILSDGVSDAVLQDIVVDPAWRGKGVGKELVRRLVENLQTTTTVDWIGLIGVPGSGPFYRRCGWTELRDYVPFRYLGEQ